MAEIQRFPVFRHLRGEPSQQILRYRRGRLSRSGRGLAFWFHPLSTSIAEVPMDNRELPFLFHGRSRDFQDTVVQGVITYRVQAPEDLAERVDFTIDLRTGGHRHTPLEKIGGMITELSQQFAMDYLVHTDLKAILADGVDEIRGRIETGLRGDAGLEEMGILIVSVRVGAITPENEVERALQVKVREAIQQQADEATFQRRAMAVEKERAIQENELQNEIELARREEQLIAQRGENERKRAADEADAARIASEAAAERAEIKARARAAGITAVEDARVGAERERMDIYREFPAERMLGLAAQKLAGKLHHIEHLNLTPDLLGSLLTNLVGVSTKRLEAGEES